MSITVEIHRTCEQAYDGEIVGPACEECLNHLGRMDYYSGAGDW